MKTAISIPDPIFQAAEVMAKHLGISRSELFTVAVSKYIEAHDDQAITQSLNKIFSQTENELDDVMVKMQLNSLQKEKW